MLPFGLSEAQFFAVNEGDEFKEMNLWVLILSSLIPGIIIGITTLIAFIIEKRFPRMFFFLLCFFPVIITLYVTIQFLISFLY